MALFIECSLARHAVIYVYYFISVQGPWCYQLYGIHYCDLNFANGETEVEGSELLHKAV